ncbi:MAG: hypothetical protein AAB438_01155 [Patescibacteria group bacterium]
MAIIEIHGKKVHVDDDSKSAKHAADYLNKLDSSEAKNFFHTAATDRFSHFETPRHVSDTNLHHDMTLEHKDDGTYSLRKRTHH